MEQGIKMLEELGWESYYNSEDDLMFFKDKEKIKIRKFGIKHENFEGLACYLSLEEAKACIMIMEEK